MKHYMPLIIIISMLFISVGDKVFPGAVGKTSTQTRTALNNFFVNLFPSWEPKTKPYERTEKQLQDIEKQQ